MSETYEFIEKLRHVAVKHQIDVVLHPTGWVACGLEEFEEDGTTNLELIEWVDSMCGDEVLG